MDRIDPIRPHDPSIPRVPAVRRNESATDKRERERQEPRQGHREPPPQDAPPDDGLPHVDVRA